MIKVRQSGVVADDVRQLVHSVNYSEVILPFPVLPGTATITAGAGATTLGGWHVDRETFRRLLPDARWLLYAAGELNTGDFNVMTMSLIYSGPTGVLTTLGTATILGGGGLAKVAIGPFDVFATVPSTDPIPGFLLRGTKAAGTNATVARWCMWLRLLAEHR